MPPSEAGKLQFREGNMHGSPWLQLLTGGVTMSERKKILCCAVGVLMVGLLDLGLLPLQPTKGWEMVTVSDRRPFEGLKALVIEPESFWGWDALTYGSLEERGFDVTYAKPEALEDDSFLAQFDLVASNITRIFTSQQVAGLKRFVTAGGSLYGSWGGPMFTSDLLSFCHVASTKSVRISGMTLCESPLSSGIAEQHLAFPPRIGNMRNDSWEIVGIEPTTGGIIVAKDVADRPLGVLGSCGKGRTAVLGFAPDNEKYFVRREVGPVMTDNLLHWLLEDRIRSGERRWTGALEVSLPVRADVMEVSLNGRRLTQPQVREVGSLKKIVVNVNETNVGQEVTIRVAYQPLQQQRNVETVIHMPWRSFDFFIANREGTPEKLAEWLKSVHATVCQPLLREADDLAYYRGLPEDVLDPLVADYEGDFLADFIEECHKREIKVIGGVYLGSRMTLQQYPDAAVVKRTGEAEARQACFNNPVGQKRNFEVIRHLVRNYQLDGLILDDNFELQNYDCCCGVCQDGFREYCAKHGVTYQAPSQAVDSGVMGDHWVGYKLEATRNLATQVTQIAHERGIPAGGWVAVGMRSAHLAPVFDFLGGMVYAEPPRAARLMLSGLDSCRFITLLWGPDQEPERLQLEFRQAIWSGSRIVGFWVYPPGHPGGGGVKMAEGSFEAIASAFAGAEDEWFKFYRENLLMGDPRFAIVDGKLGKEEMILRVKNTGNTASIRLQGDIDLNAAMPIPRVPAQSNSVEAFQGYMPTARGM